MKSYSLVSAVFVALFTTAPLPAAERWVLVSTSQARDILKAESARKRRVEIVNPAGVLKGRLETADSDSVTLTNKRVIPFATLRQARIDLGPNRSAQVTGGLLGLSLGGGYLGLAAGETGHEALGGLAIAASLAGGAWLGGRNRNWLTLTVVADPPSASSYPGP